MTNNTYSKGLQTAIKKMRAPNWSAVNQSKRGNEVDLGNELYFCSQLCFLITYVSYLYKRSVVAVKVVTAFNTTDSVVVKMALK